MAIARNEYDFLKRLRESGALPDAPSLLELGESNWYGDVPPDELRADALRLGAEFPETNWDDKFSVAKGIWRSVLGVASFAAIDLDGDRPVLHHDLNTPLPGETPGYDLVANLGTAEHIFDVRQMFETAHRLCKPGGVLLHSLPCGGWVNHGFYNFQPTFLADLARANGYEILALAYAVRGEGMVYFEGDPALTESARQGLFRRAADGMLFAAFRRATADTFRVPLQGYYAGALTPEQELDWKASQTAEAKAPATLREWERRQLVAPALKIDGWLTEPEGLLLHDLARNADGPIAEIGSWQGRSTACLALGSMRGRGNNVFAIDPFTGPKQALVRATTLGNVGAEDVEVSPQLLRKNLDAAGVNGLVAIVPLASQDALPRVPPLSLLFIDGDHHYESVCRDIDNYMPKLKTGGIAVFHDVTQGDPGVVRAIEDRIFSRPLEYRVLDRVGSALVVRKVKTEPRTVLLACPGGSFKWGTVKGIIQASMGAHEVQVENNGNGWDDFNHLWAKALNKAEAGEITHFAMLHSDIEPCPGWLDLLMDEIEEKKADLVSVACPIKDTRGVLNCGLGAPDNPWGAWRRLTVRELQELPPSFNAASLGHPDKVTLHNTGCFVADLRGEVFFKTDDAGNLIADFAFPTRIFRDEGGAWSAGRESEDWHFSRKLHELGVRGFITRKVRLHHIGDYHYANDEPWGTFEAGDESTAPNWRKS